MGVSRCNSVSLFLEILRNIKVLKKRYKTTLLHAGVRDYKTATNPDLHPSRFVHASTLFIQMLVYECVSLVLTVFKLSFLMFFTGIGDVSISIKEIPRGMLIILHVQAVYIPSDMKVSMDGVH
jgi:hypothetical protein